MAHHGGTYVAELERVLRTHQVREEEDFSTLIIRSTLDGIYTYDLDHVITLWNPAMERITGMKKERVLGRDVFEVAPHLQKFGLEHLILEPLKGKTIRQAEVPFEIPETGNRGFVRRLSSPLMDEDGQVVGGLCIVHEITGRKEAQDEVIVRRRAEDSLKFLSEAGMLLSETLDYQEILERIIRLTSKHFGAWTKLRLLQEDGEISVFCGHEDPRIAKDLAQLETRYPPSEDLKEGPLWILRNGGNQFYPRITEDMNRAFAKDPEHFRLLSLVCSYICVPIEASGRIFGTFSLLGTERGFTEQDLSLACDLARWIAAALDNARLYSLARGASR